jgi:integrase
MRIQKGYVFHKGTAWFLRYFDDVLMNGTVQRRQVCKKLDVSYGGEFKTKKSVAPFVQKILAPLNAGTLNPQSTMTVAAFVDTVYIPQHIEKTLRPASRKQARDTWRNHLKPRVDSLTLRTFRTVHGEKILAQIAEQAKLGRSSLRHCKAFLSGCFKQAKRLGILDGVNPMQDVSIPRVPEAEQDTHAYSFAEVKTHLARVPEPARTVVYTAAFAGLTKSELRGLLCDSLNEDANQLSITRSVWNGFVGDPKTRARKAPVPVLKPLADALKKHLLRMGKLAQPGTPLFQGGTGRPLNLDNLARRAIKPAIERCTQCQRPEAVHPKIGHAFELDEACAWHGWHAYRRGLATNLHALGVPDKTVQAILRHSNVKTTQNIYIKTIDENRVNALDLLDAKIATCNELAPNATSLVN